MFIQVPTATGFTWVFDPTSVPPSISEIEHEREAAEFAAERRDDDVGWKEHEHPRVAKGQEGGGQFTSGGGSASLPDLPPKPSLMAKKMHQIAAAPDLSKWAKIVQIQKKVPNQDVTKEYKKALIAALHKAEEPKKVEEPKPKEPEPDPDDQPSSKAETPSSEEKEGPKPHPDSQDQQNIHSIAQGSLLTKEEKVNEIVELANKKPAGSYTHQFAKQWVEKLGGDSSKVGAKAPGIATEEGGKITRTTNTMRLKRATQYRATAADLLSAGEPDSAKVCPTLNRNWWKKIDPAAREACTSYKGGSGSINGALREKNTESAAAWVQDSIDHIDELFEHEDAKLKADVILRRGEGIPDEVIAEMKAGLAAGKPVRPQRLGFTSTSMAGSAAFSGQNCIYEIIARKGTPALGLWAADTGFKGENEVLLRHGSVFEVYEIEKVGSQHIIRCMTL
jgi:hypothetical protein